MEPEDRFLRARLRSGIEVVGEPIAGVESASLGLVIGVGARDEPSGSYGISHFSEGLLFRGTETRDARQISEQFDLLGASYDASAGIEMTVMSAQMIGDRLPQVLDLLLDCARNSTFPDEAVDSVRALVFQELRLRDDRPAQKVMDLVRRELFAQNPLGNDLLGTEETVQGIDRDALIRFHSTHYHPANLAISVAGRFDWDALIERLEQLTDGWAAGDRRQSVPAPSPRAGVSVLNKHDAAQEHLGFAFPGVCAGDERYFVAALLAQALGGGTSSRLHVEVREKRGLAYAAQARFDGLAAAGLVRMYVGTSADRAPESVDVIYDVLRALQEHGLTADELHRAKTRVKSQVVMRSESSYARMASNLRSWWLERRLRSLEDVARKIDAVTLSGILSLLEDLRITENIAAVALGPRTREELFDRVPAPS